MNDTKIKIVRHRKNLASKKKVTAYARVSTGKDAMLHSLSAQVSYTIARSSRILAVGSIVAYTSTKP